MPFCPKCGNEYQEGTKFCGKCGQTLAAASQAAQAAQQTTQAAAPVAPVAPVKTGPGFFEKLLNTKDITDTLDPNDITNNKVVAILAYSALYVFIVANWFLSSFITILITAALLVAPCILAAKSKFLQCHLGQVFTALFGTIIVRIIESQLASWIFWGFYDTLGSTVGRIPGTILAWLVHIIFMAVPLLIITAGVVFVAKGKAKRLPLIGKFNFTTSD